MNNEICEFCGEPYNNHTFCEDCGYTECDKIIHGDHRICEGKKRDNKCVRQTSERTRTKKEKSGQTSLS